ncbi:peptidyl-prolyl cis-trans isomerase SurA [Haloferula luteola]|uniref:peptidylprolyl isomerase n=1 Tax=Haloferula luteola TaxID=595692 RepID=A0A840V4R6_9BACT|nr:peptidylprolyl isomerase [Haloferula luteola]MBB5352036.1 peptidyl-prolyl cis-trans isomerase SurA [Haloferula luteola]
MNLRVLGLSLALLSPLTAQSPEGGGMVEVNRIAATVNSRLITAKDVGMMMGPEVGRLMAEFPRRGPEFERQLKEVRDQVLKELIDRELIMSEFRKREQKGANLPDRVVDQEIQRQVRELYSGDMQKLRDELAKGRMSMSSYRELTREKLIVQAMRQEKFKDAAPPMPSEIDAEYRMAKDNLRDTSKDIIDYRKIFIPRIDANNPLATPDTQLAQAESLAEKLKEGADFAELAKESSADAFASEGGLQTHVPRPDLSPEFAAILFDAEEGKVIGPLEDPAGFTIAKVERIQKGPAPPLSEVKELIDQRVRAKKTSERYDKWIEELRSRAMIDIKLK